MNPVYMQEKVTRKQNRAHLIALIQYFGGNTVDAMELSIKCLCTFGVSANWHEYSSALDQMHQHDQVSIVGFKNDGMTRYQVKR